MTTLIAQDAHGSTALLRACLVDAADVAHSLIAAKANPLALNRYGFTPVSVTKDPQLLRWLQHIVKADTGDKPSSHHSLHPRRLDSSQSDISDMMSGIERYRRLSSRSLRWRCVCLRLEWCQGELNIASSAGRALGWCRWGLNLASAAGHWDGAAGG